jgi:hypothetical protein
VPLYLPLNANTWKFWCVRWTPATAARFHIQFRIPGPNAKRSSVSKAVPTAAGLGRYFSVDSRARIWQNNDRNPMLPPDSTISDWSLSSDPMSMLNPHACSSLVSPLSAWAAHPASLVQAHRRLSASSTRQEKALHRSVLASNSPIAAPVSTHVLTATAQLRSSISVPLPAATLETGLELQIEAVGLFHLISSHLNSTIDVF